METSVYDFLKYVDDRNRASEMALRYAALILSDLRELTPRGRRLMADILTALITGERKGDETQH